MVNDDVLFRFRLRLFSLAEELGNVRAACRYKAAGGRGIQALRPPPMGVNSARRASACCSQTEASRPTPI